MNTIPNLKKLGIGTVQFGLNYGINNQIGIVPQVEIDKILDLAKKFDIKLIDTAISYGISENVIGESGFGSNFEVVTKLPSNVNNIEKEINGSLSRLKIPSLYGCLFHDINDFKNNHKLLGTLESMKFNGLTKKVGFSVYFPQEVEYLFEKGVRFDLIQLPYNLFDRRFEYLFPILKDKNIEIHVRSVFLQGLFFKPIESLGKHFDTVKEKLFLLRKYCLSKKIPLNNLLIHFVLTNQYIDKIIIGVDNVKNLRENIEIIEDFQENLQLEDLLLFKEMDENILIPYNWK